MAAEIDALDIQVERGWGGREVDERVDEIGDGTGSVHDVSVSYFSEGDLLECFDCSGDVGVFLVGFLDGSDLVGRRVCVPVSYISRDMVTAYSPTITGP